MSSDVHIDDSEWDAEIAARCRAWDSAREETAKARSKEHISFDEAIDWVIDYLAADEEEDFECSGRPADHVWRAVQVLMRHRSMAD